MEWIKPAGIVGSAVPRVDGVGKVTGAILYGDDERIDGAAWAYLATSAVAKGRIRHIDETAARTLPGVLEILTHRNVGHAIKPGDIILNGGHMGSSLAPLRSDEIAHAEQIIAVVIAETFETARAAAASLVVSYHADEPSATFGSPGVKEVPAKARGETEISKGSFEKAFAAAPVQIDQRYETPPQHHNPLELYQATCAWDGQDLTVWESSQHVGGYQHGIAHQLGINPRHVRVISRFIGGAFGSRGELAQSTALVALAAQRLKRPVKFVASRRQCFSLRTFRAETRHHVRLGADRDGRLLALSHHGWELTSRTDRFALAGIESTARVYACDNIDASTRNVEADRQTPGFMRAPPEMPYMFALESAMDELAWALKMDPIELRRRNDTQTDPIKGIPFSSRSLMRCFDVASTEFGWSKREPAVGAMRRGDWLIGYGCATSIYPSQMAPASCRVTLSTDALVKVETASHDIGTGLYTIISQTAADLLGAKMQQVTVVLGDSDLPAAPLTAGSSTTASLLTVVAKACEQLRDTLATAAVKSSEGQLHGLEPDSIRLHDNRLIGPAAQAEPLSQSVRRVTGGGPLVAEVHNNPSSYPRLIESTLLKHGTGVMVAGSMHKDAIRYAFGAQFVEVRVHHLTGEIRVPRMVGAYAAGRIVNPRTARSQLMGGQIWGMSSALLEATEIDKRFARYTNADLAEYLIPTNADVQEVTTLFVAEEDRIVNPLGVKGLGELGVVGMNAAIANAIYHATGVRLRKLPIRIDESLLQSPAMRMNA